MKRRLCLLLAGSLAALSIALAAPAGANVHLVGGQTQRSTDGGTTWSAPDGTQLEGISLVPGAANTLVAVGTSGMIRRSTNGGTSWSTIASPSALPLHDVSFFASTGFIAGNSVLLTSTDAGATWTTLTPAAPAPVGDLTALSFGSTTAGVLGNSAGMLFRTTDGGVHWAQTANLLGGVNDMQMINASTAFAVGFFGKFGKTTDGGANWTVTTIDASSDLFGVHFVSATTGWAVGTLGKVFRTTDGGVTWTVTGTAVGNGAFRCVAFMNNQEGIIGGDGVTLRTLDGGTTWHDVVGFTGIRHDVVVDAAGLLPNRVTVTVSSNPAGRTFMVDGATLTGPATVVWQTNEVHPVAAISPQTVSATERFQFQSWSDGGGSSHSVTAGVGPTQTLTVNYTRQFMLTMSSGGNGTVSPASGFRDAGSSVNINATPNNGYQFSQWTGAGTGSYTGTTAARTITMNSAITQTASFVGAPFPVTVRTTPTGRSFTVDGTTYTTTQTFNWVTGSTHSLGTTATQSAGTGTRYQFTSWSDGGAQNHNVTANPSVTTYTASFQLQYQLTMTGSGARHTPVPGTGWHNAGASVAIDDDVDPFVFPQTFFTGWSGTGTGSYTGPLQQTTIVMNGPITQAIQVSTLPNRLVWIGTSPTSRSYRVGTTSYTGWNPFRFVIGSSPLVSTDSIQAGTATSRFRFLDWSDGGRDTHNVAVDFNGPDTLLARFRGQLLLTMNGSNVTLSPGTSFHDAGSAVLIQATPAPNFAFTGWTGVGSGSVSGPSNPTLVTMNSAITQTAQTVGLPVSVTLQTTPSGGRVTLNGNTVTSPFTTAIPAGTTIQVGAVTPFELSPEKRIVFDSWSDGGAASHAVTIMGPTTLTANGHFQYSVTAQVGAGGGGTVTGGGWFDPGATVTLTATPDPGRAFVGWSGNGYTGTQNPATFTIGGTAVTQTATFSSNVGADDGTPLSFALAPCAPNPVTSAGTRIAFTLPAGAMATLEVLDLAGRRVAMPASGWHDAGRHDFRWNASDDDHRPLGAGIYYVRLRSEGREQIRRIAVTR